MKKILFVFSILINLQSKTNNLFSQTINPQKFIATLKFDDQYQDYFTSKKEQMFPISFYFNTTQDGNNDSIINAEDACENIVRYAIGDSIFGTGRTGISGRGPNDQRPSVYFHYLKRGNYDVYEYWLYYADNDYLNDHEHDWEKYFVYVQDTAPVYLMISNHSNFNLFSWCELPEDSDHIIIGVDGGAHAMGNNTQNGVKIRYNGEVSKNSGQLNFGDGQTLPWRIYSNDFNVFDAINYTESPDDFFNGDPVYPDIPQLSSSEEYGSSSAAPWKRSEWNDPPSVPIVNLGIDKSICSGNSITLEAGSGYNSYLWSDGSSTQSIEIDSAGIYSVTVEDNFGCVSRDTIEVVEINSNPIANFTYTNSGSTCFFNDSSENAFGWSWDFGTSTSSASNPTHSYPGPGIYGVCLIVTNDCGSDTICDSIIISPFGNELSEDYLSENEIIVFPNPANEKILLQINSSFYSSKELSFVLTDINGKVVKKIRKLKDETTQINAADFSEGIYFYEVKNGNELIKNGKIILQ